MLTAADEPIIRRAIMRRLDKEHGVRVLEIHIVDHPKAHPPYVAVGILTHVDDKSIGRSRFHLHSPFSLSELVNQIDEIAEQCKAERGRVRLIRFPDVFGQREEEIEAKGTGLRGAWPELTIRSIQ